LNRPIEEVLYTSTALLAALEWKVKQI